MTTVIEDRIASLLIRHLRPGTASAFERPRLQLIRDRSLVRMYWSLSRSVSALLAHFRFNRHEAIPQRREARTISGGLIRGRYAPSQSVLLAARTGQLHQTVCLEPEHSYETGPNRVLGWTIRTAAGLLYDARSVVPRESPQAALVHQRLGVAEPALRLLASLDDSFTGRIPKPTGRDLAGTRRSRKRLYRLAAGAFDILERCEGGDTETLRQVLTETVVSPARAWQRFELLTLLSMAEALALELDVPVQLRLLTPDERAIAVVGPYALHWQSRTSLFMDPEEEPSERRTRELLASYGLGASWDRPDVVVVNTIRNTVAAIGEAKYTESEEDTAAAFREGIGQLVRYARGYEASTPPTKLLPRSLIAVRRRPQAVDAAANAPAIATLDDLLDAQRLRPWAHTLITRP